jgi:hypothetical protein
MTNYLVENDENCQESFSPWLISEKMTYFKKSLSIVTVYDKHGCYDLILIAENLNFEGGAYGMG